MPCPSTGPKMFRAGPNFLWQTKNWFMFRVSPNKFVADQKMISIS